MKIERIKELLEIVKTNPIKYGICFSIRELDIPEEESLALLKWFQQQKPRKRKNYQFTKHSTFTHIDRNWWTRDEQGNEERINFINHLLKNL